MHPLECVATTSATVAIAEPRKLSVIAIAEA